MAVCLRERDRCRICFTLLQRDRSTLFSSVCCQKYSHLFQPTQRAKFPRRKHHAYAMKTSTRTVCFGDLLNRYLHAQVNAEGTLSSWICSDCSTSLLDIEQCAKYLRKTINQVKTKFNKASRLFTSSLFAKYQQKKSKAPLSTTVKNEALPLLNSDDDEDFDDIDDEEFDDEPGETKPTMAKSLHYTSSSSSAGDSLPTAAKYPCNNNEETDGDETDEDSSTLRASKQEPPSNASHYPSLAAMNPSSIFMNTLDETNPNMLQLRLLQMMNSASAGQNNGTHAESMMNTFAAMQRNLFLKIFTDPMAAAHAAQAAQAALSASQAKTMASPASLLASPHKQSSSSRKRKSTPEKRVITHHHPRSTSNNGEEHEFQPNSLDNAIDHPLELTVKGLQRSNHLSSSTDLQNLAMSSKGENGSSAAAAAALGPCYHSTDEDVHEGATTPNDLSASLSPSLHRRTTPSSSKRPRLSTGGPLEYSNHLPTGTADLLSPNHRAQSADETSNSNNNHQRQPRKLDPRTCSQCGKVLFSDKTHLLHCQTHVRNERQCWICGVNDDDIKKHILTEHGNQKFSSAGFKCQHCEKVFPIFADLEVHGKEHSKKKPFECPICHKRFGQQGNLSCHLRIHSGVKPFTCISCGKAFRHSNSLRRHARTVHSASRSFTTSSNSLVSDTATLFTDEMKMEPFDEHASAPMAASDESSSSSDGLPSPAMSNVQLDSDSPEPSGIH